MSQKTEKTKSPQDEKEKKYIEAMGKADELEKEGKYREAWVKVPDPSLFPEKAEIIQKRRSELSAKFAPDLFASIDSGAMAPRPQASITPSGEDDIRDDGNWEDEENGENGEENETY